MLRSKVQSRERLIRQKGSKENYKRIQETS